MIFRFLKNLTRLAEAEAEPCVIWFTGPSATGKSTIADLVFAELVKMEIPVERLDGDTVRKFLPDTGFEKEAREAHIRRIGYLASRLESHGVTVVASFISPDRDAREFVRSLCARFIEVQVSTPLQELKRRDPKGLYRKAERGEIRNMVGIDTPYEAPLAPELKIETLSVTAEEAAALVIRAHRTLSLSPSNLPRKKAG